MKKPKEDLFAEFLLFLVGSGVAFYLPYRLVCAAFGIAVPGLPIVVILIIGNISTIMLAFMVPYIERITGTKDEEKILH